LLSGFPENDLLPHAIRFDVLCELVQLVVGHHRKDIGARVYWKEIAP
jgi:hypothetical protein